MTWTRARLREGNYDNISERASKCLRRSTFALKICAKDKIGNGESDQPRLGKATSLSVKLRITGTTQSGSTRRIVT